MDWKIARRLYFETHGERGEFMGAYGHTLRDVPIEERPRERMKKFGAQALSNAEVLAILLRTGTVKESAVTLAQRILKQCGHLRNLTDISYDQLISIKGVGDAKALQIQAGIGARSSTRKESAVRYADDSYT